MRQIATAMAPRQRGTNSLVRLVVYPGRLSCFSMRRFLPGAAIFRPLASNTTRTAAEAAAQGGASQVPSGAHFRPLRVASRRLPIL